MEIFSVKNLSFSYPGQSKKILSDISITINRGEFALLCGKSGCGKTTLLRQLKTVLAPHGKMVGEIWYSGRLLPEVPLTEQASAIGYVQQHPDHQLVTDKVWHELAFGLENLGYSQQLIELRTAEMADYMGISGWYQKETTKISGGQKQLLNLAAVIAMQPKILILDEPTSQLDPLAAADFLQMLKRLNEEFGTTILLSAHRLDEVYAMADHVLVMDEGKMIADDLPRQIGNHLGGHELEKIMPTPIRMHLALNAPSNQACPLTIKEGREYLSQYLGAGIEREIGSRPQITRANKEEHEVILKAKDVWFRYEKNDKDVLADLSLQLKRGEVYALLGANGSGKTTALSVLGGLKKAYRGNVRINGRMLNSYRDKELLGTVLGILPQDPQTLFTADTVAEEISDSQLMERMALSHLLHQHPYDLSGGEQQRLALAKVISSNPQILFLDEPTKGMDACYKIGFGAMLREWSQQGLSILLVSHDVEFCAEYADTCGLFFQGKIVAQKEAREFFAGNSFYTTAANRMSRHLFENAVTVEEVEKLCSQYQNCYL